MVSIGYLYGMDTTDTDSDTDSDTDTVTDTITVTDTDPDTVTVIDDNNIFSLIEKNFGRTLNSIEIEEIKSWEDNELTRYAIKVAVLKNKYNIKNDINTWLQNNPDFLEKHSLTYKCLTFYFDNEIIVDIKYSEKNFNE